MQDNVITVDLFKLIKFVLKHIWLPIGLALIGFGLRYWYTTNKIPDTYTASGTMYVYNGNPNLVNYQYASSSDLDSAVQLIDTYMIVVRSNKVMDVIVERLADQYPGITPEFISGTLSMRSVSETGVVRVSSTTFDPQISTDICNTVLDVAPAEIIRVVGAGNIEIIDYAMVPKVADSKSLLRRSVIGFLLGGLLGGIVLLVLFLLNRKISDTKDLTDNYTPAVLSSIRRSKKNSKDAGDFLLTANSEMEKLESYAKLRMNLLYMLAGKDSHAVVITSAISGEGKSTIAANLAISCAMAGKKVLLVDGDMRRACQRDIFGYDRDKRGLSEILADECSLQDAVLKDINSGLDLLPAGTLPPNPAELLGTDQMIETLSQVENAYDLVLLDMPPINIVTDPLVLSRHVAGCLFVTRQNYTDHRDIRKALISSEMTGMNVMGFVFYGEKINQDHYYREKTYKTYYSKYDNRSNSAALSVKKRHGLKN